MAARKVRTTLNDRWKERIQASMLVNRLMDHAVGECELTGTQLRAIEILLKKVAPDLAAIQHSGDENNPLAIAMIERKIVK